MNILLTGGTGYIGSHTAVVLSEAGHRVVLLDNLCNSQAEVVDRIASLVGYTPVFVKADIRETDRLTSVLQDNDIHAVVHFAGLKAVGESVAAPLLYYGNNVSGTVSLLDAMNRAKVRNLVFSSSATVYGVPQYLPIDELHPTGATNPYGRTKLHIEHMLAELAHADPSWKIASLRYFNPAGAHHSGLIGENPSGIPNNLMPFIVRVAAGKLPVLQVFGDDYDTTDGTGVRDYIHVMDLAEGHLAALKYLQQTALSFDTFNLGTGSGYSVLQMVRSFESVNNCQVAHQIAPRRPGDIAACYASVDKARHQLGWTASRSLDDMCRTAWLYQG